MERAVDMDETPGTEGSKKGPGLFRQVWREVMRDVRRDLRRVTTSAGAALAASPVGRAFGAGPIGRSWRARSPLVRRAILVGAPVLLVLLLVSVVVPALFAPSLTGTWTESSRNGSPIVGTPSVIQINADGTGTFNGSPVKVSYPDGGHISFGPPSGTGFAIAMGYHQDGDTLMLTAPNDTDVFHKQTRGFLGLGPAPTPFPTAIPTDTAAPTDTPAPTDTTIPTDTPLPTSTPTLTPIPLHIQARAVPVSTAGSSASSSAQVRVSAGTQRVALLDGEDTSANALTIADARTGKVATVIPLNSAGRLDVDYTHGHALMEVDAPYGATSYVANVTLSSGAAITRTLPQDLQGDSITAWVADPTSGGALLAARGESFTNVASRIASVSPSGRVRHRGTLGNDASTLYIDPHDRTVVAVEGGSFSSDAPLEGFDTATLQRTWAITLDYGPTAYAVDPIHGNLWLMAQGGRTQILSMANGQIIHTIDLSYAKPDGWNQNTDLVVDGARDVGYISWSNGSFVNPAMSIDRIDPRSGKRTTLAASSGGPLLATLTSGKLLAQDANKRLVMLDQRTGALVETIADPNGLAAGSAGGSGGFSSVGVVGSPDIDEVNHQVLIAYAATVQYQNDVSGNNTAPGLVTITFRDPSS